MRRVLWTAPATCGTGSLGPQQCDTKHWHPTIAFRKSTPSSSGKGGGGSEPQKATREPHQEGVPSRKKAAKEHVALRVHTEAWCIGLLHESVKIQGLGAAHCDAHIGMTVGGCAQRELWHRQEARRGEPQAPAFESQWWHMVSSGNMSRGGSFGSCSRAATHCDTCTATVPQVPGGALSARGL